MHRILEFLRCEDGPTAVEYAIMLALIIAVSLSAINAVGTNVSSSFNQSREQMDTYFEAAGVGQ